MRVLADLPDDDLAWLDERAAQLGTSRAQLLRDAVAAYRAEARRDGLDSFFGIWAERTKART
jgi:hypothetical protein